MGWFGKIDKNPYPQAAELNQLREELQCVAEQLESPESELAEALGQQTHRQRDPVGNRELATDIRPVPS